MFDISESIEEGYLWNFSPAERRRFYSQHQEKQASMQQYNAKLFAMVATDEPAIFGNDDHPSSPLEIKYTLNRIHMNDPRETELLLNAIDPVAPKQEPYPKKLVWAFEDNTFCQRVVLNGIRSRDGWSSRGFNDEEASDVLDVFSDKKLTELTFASFPLLTDVTYLKIANIVSRPDNRWTHVTLGHIPVAPDIAGTYNRTGKVSYTRIARPRTSKSFFSRLFHRGQTNERS